MNKTIKFLNFSLLSLFVFSTTTASALDLSRYLETTNYMDEKTISMDFQSANLNDVLKIFSQQSGLNFIAASDVANEPVTLYLDKVPVNLALEQILSSRNLTYEIDPDSNIFLVKRLIRPDDQVITRVYPLKFATVPNAKLLQTLSDFEDAGETVRDDSDEFGIVGVINSLLTENGSLVEDPRTNSLIITDIPSQFPKIEQAIARLDVRVPQILIEVEMLDVSSTAAEDLGLEWGSNGQFQPVVLSGANKETYFPFDGTDSLGAENLVTTSDTAVSGFFSNPGQVDFRGLILTIDAIKTHSETKSLARPRILTLNNETAEIRISTDEVIGVDFEVSQDGGASETTAEREETGVFLLVTPQANIDTGEIKLAVQPKVIQARTSTGIANAANFKDIEERGTKSILRILNGDTVVLGGLLKTDTEDSASKVPFLSDIPVFGLAFRSKSNEQAERELIVFLTPHIIHEDLPKSITAMKNKPLIRERATPTKRQREINRELTLHEKKRF